MLHRRTDTERLNALERLAEQGDCPALVNDDNGRWAVTGDGMQSVPLNIGAMAVDLETSFFVKAAQWRMTIREAIDAYLDETEKDLFGGQTELNDG